MNQIVGITAVVAAVIASLFLFLYSNSTTQKIAIGDQGVNETFPTKILGTVKVPWSSNGTFGGTIINGTYDGIDKTEGIVKLNNQSYFMTTLDGNLKSVIFNEPNGTAVEFANVTFTFARPPNLPLPTNPILPVIVQFQDGANETLYVQIQKDFPQTVLSSHANPRAAITITQGNQLMMTNPEDNQGRVKLLVSTN